MLKEIFLPGDIVFCRSKGIIPSLIRARTMSRWDMVGVLVGRKTGCGWKTISAKYGGVVYEKLMKWNGYIQILRVNDMTDAQRDIFVNFCLEQIGKPYDFWCLLDFFCLRRSQKDTKWFCSQLIYHGLLKAGIDLFDAKNKPKFINISDLYESPRLKFLADI